jgi:hypothetical protein
MLCRITSGLLRERSGLLRPHDEMTRPPSEMAVNGPLTKAKLSCRPSGELFPSGKP